METWLVHRLVAVAEHDEVGVGEPPVQPCSPAMPCAAVMHHRHRETFDVKLERLGKLACEFEIVVPEHCMHGRVALQVVEHFPHDDVTGVEDDVRPLQRGNGAGWQTSGGAAPDVRVREHDDTGRA